MAALPQRTAWERADVAKASTEQVRMEWDLLKYRQLVSVLGDLWGAESDVGAGAMSRKLSEGQI